ncbi:hypothetical protein ACFY0A_18410 [Streptomyces sp. NPDC001698]|uniref:hypothetical protein n=1 Tax=unclassified Streptomyces TaxID=2593676 RepID=UPI0036D11D8B
MSTTEPADRPAKPQLTGCEAILKRYGIARAFAPDRLTATIEALTLASVAASTAETHTPEQAQARQAIKDCERRLARYQVALEAGADPLVVTLVVSAWLLGFAHWFTHALVTSPSSTTSRPPPTAPRSS